MPLLKRKDLSKVKKEGGVYFIKISHSNYPFTTLTFRDRKKHL